MKFVRITILYCLFWMIAFIAGLGFGPENVGSHMAFTFLAPVVGVWLIERRISRKRNNQEEQELNETFAMLEALNLEAVKRDKITLSKAIDMHSSALQRNFRKAVTKNDYGALVRDDREIAAEEFLASTQLELEGMEISEATNYIQAVLNSIEDEDARGGFDSKRMPTNGLEFEEYVATGLKSFGWDAKATQGSGDQGIDVIAVKDGLSLGIQCKRYSGSVGNKAIQEAYSGMKHFGLDKAAVLTNANFTKSAKELAASTGVLLLSPEDIPTLSERPELNS